MAPCTSLSSYAGMPSGLILPFAFGIYVRLTGSGLYWYFFIRSSSRIIFSSAFSSYCALSTPSTPVAFFLFCFLCSAIRVCRLTQDISPCTVGKCSAWYLIPFVSCSIGSDLSCPQCFHSGYDCLLTPSLRPLSQVSSLL